MALPDCTKTWVRLYRRLFEGYVWQTLERRKVTHLRNDLYWSWQEFRNRLFNGLFGGLIFGLVFGLIGALLSGLIFGLVDEKSRLIIELEDYDARGGGKKETEAEKETETERQAGCHNR
jgi:hypothetical protein